MKSQSRPFTIGKFASDVVIPSKLMKEANRVYIDSGVERMQLLNILILLGYHND